MLFLDPRFYLALLVTACLAMVGGYTTGHKAATKTAQVQASKMMAAAAVARADAEAKLRAAEQKGRDDLAALDAKHFKEKQDADAKTKELVGRLRAGAVSLSIPAKCANSAARPGDTTTAGGTGNEARAELEREAAESLIAIAADGDEAIRQLNAVIDAYSAARTTCRVTP